MRRGRKSDRPSTDALTDDALRVNRSRARQQLSPAGAVAIRAAAIEDELAAMVLPEDAAVELLLRDGQHDDELVPNSDQEHVMFEAGGLGEGEGQATLPASLFLGDLAAAERDSDTGSEQEDDEQEVLCFHLLTLTSRSTIQMLMARQHTTNYLPRSLRS